MVARSPPPILCERFAFCCRWLWHGTVLHNERERKISLSFYNFHLWDPWGRVKCFFIFLVFGLVRTDSRGPLWSESQGARLASGVTHLFISLFITFAATFLQSCYFVVYLQKALWVKFISNVLWVEKGREGQESNYVIGISVNDPFFLIRADGEMETEEAHRLMHRSMNGLCNLRCQMQRDQLEDLGKAAR